MTLTTHGIVGAAVASLFPAAPLVGIAAGFASHFCIDAIPHWDYQPRSLHKDPSAPLKTDMVLGKDFVKDLGLIGGDAMLGVCISAGLWFFGILHAPLLYVVLGACAGILPDALQFVYFKTRTKLLLHLQRFHIWIQSGAHLRGHPFLGISSQILLVAFVVAIAYRY